jgi:aminopeptidase N
MSTLRKIALNLLTALPIFAFAQRLPEGVTPQHYSLTLTPDLGKATFSGEETIDITLLKPASSITLNAAELEIPLAEATQTDKTVAAQVSFDPAKEQATLTFATPLEAGAAKLHFKYSGTLNDQLRGFYLARSASRNYAVTQFESTDARRAFPSFDEPALKATFDVTLIVDRADTAISNGFLEADTTGPGETKHTLKFSTTPKMSTYLVAMAVGDFVCNQGMADNTPIRVCSTPDKKPLSTLAVKYAEEILQFYNRYYGTPYPFGKLDIVAAPDFDAGAMENTAAIFYREAALLIDEKTASPAARAQVFGIMAHEMAHQWFGDLVTMKWWDNLWLNESFATWMEVKPAQSLHPEWTPALEALAETNGALTVDALKSTHPIRAHAETPEEIGALFDGISYGKGAAVLRMIETYVTPETFRRGVNLYLRKFAYSNATAEDFWNALGTASGRPVARIMPTFVDQPGVPLITVKAACIEPPPEPKVSRKSKRRRQLKPAAPHTEITISQSRFWGDGAHIATASSSNAASVAEAAANQAALSQTWMLPVCVKTETAKPFCQVLSQRQLVLPATGCASWMFMNANASGYYRSRYDSGTMQKLTAVAATQLSTAERISLLNDQAALAYSGTEPISTYLDLVSTLSQDAEQAVVESYLAPLGQAGSNATNESNREAFAAWVRSTFNPMFAKVGWTSSQTEGRLRASLILIEGLEGKDPAVVSQSVALAKKFLQAPESLDPSIVAAVLAVAAVSNDTDLFEHYLAALKNPVTNPELQGNLARAMARFSEPRLVTAWLEKIVSPETRSQDAPRYLSLVIQNPVSQKTAWEWTKAHWPDVEKKLAASGGEVLVGATSSFCDAESRSDAAAFFGQHKLPGTERTLKLSLEQIDACVNYRNHQQPELTNWLAKHPAAAPMP